MLEVAGDLRRVPAKFENPVYYLTVLVHCIYSKTTIHLSVDG